MRMDADRQLSLMLTVQSGAELELAEDTDADERGG